MPLPQAHPRRTFDRVTVYDDVSGGGTEALMLAHVLAPDAEVTLASGAAHRPNPSAAREHAGLVTVGRARGGPGAWAHQNDVIHGVLRGASCPVAIAPRGYAGEIPQTIGVAFHEGSGAERALSAGVELAADSGARLVVCNVVAPGDTPASGIHPLLHAVAVPDLRRARAQHVLDEAIADLGDRVEAVAVTGDVGEQLLDLATRVDLVVCGSSHSGPGRRAAPGGTSDDLADLATCAVLVLPASSAPATAPMPGAGGVPLATVPPPHRFHLRCDDVHPVRCSATFSTRRAGDLIPKVCAHGASAHGFTESWYTPARIAAMVAAVIG